MCVEVEVDTEKVISGFGEDEELEQYIEDEIKKQYPKTDKIKNMNDVLSELKKIGGITMGHAIIGDDVLEAAAKLLSEKDITTKEIFQFIRDSKSNKHTVVVKDGKYSKDETFDKFTEHEDFDFD